MPQQPRRHGRLLDLRSGAGAGASRQSRVGVFGAAPRMSLVLGLGSYGFAGVLL